MAPPMGPSAYSIDLGMMMTSLPLKKEVDYVCISIINYIFQTMILPTLTVLQKISSQWISITQKPNKSILLGNLYRPPQGDVLTCLEIIENKLSDINLQKVEVILMGDLNIDLLDLHSNIAKYLIHKKRQLGLRQLIIKHFTPIRR